jgi:carboxyl-terminal processing protease
MLIFAKMNWMKHIFALLSCAFLLISTIQGQQNTEAELNKFNTLFTYISQAYVDSVNEPKLIETAIVKMLEVLDPHSVYISAKDLRKMNEPLQGNFEGVGIQFNLFKDTIVVISPIPGGPSEKLGILAGDKIITIDNDTVAGVSFTNEKVIERLRGPKGTFVTVGIARRGFGELIPFRIKRDKIPIYSVDKGYMPTPEIGYIKVNRFARNTVEEFNAQLQTLNKRGMESLILDLRGNSGGYLNTAIELADQFLDDKKLIVYTEGRSFPRDDTYASGKGEFERGKLVVLIDEGSASASEIVAGAIQDWDRGLILGRRSFGKGLVQKPFPLPDGAAVRLTISRYYTPSGRSIQRPYGEGTKAYYEEFNERYVSGELLSEDSINLPDTLKFRTRINGRTVYGGGGIMPDIFVPADTSYRGAVYTQLVRNDALNKFALEVLDDKRKVFIKQYNNNSESFTKNFTVNQELFDAFLSYCNSEKLDISTDDVIAYRPKIEWLLKAYLARNLWDFGAYMQVINSQDPTFDRAVRVLSDNTFDKLAVHY